MYARFADDASYEGDASGVAELCRTKEAEPRKSFAEQNIFSFLGLISPEYGASGVWRASLTAILAKRYTMPESEIVIPSPDALAEAAGGNALTDIGGPMGGQWANVNHMAAEASLLLGRFVDAKALAERYERCAFGEHVKVFAPWLKARVLAAEAGTGVQSHDQRHPKLPRRTQASDSEMVSLLEKAAAAAVAWESPHMASLILQDMLALVDLAPAERSSVQSRLEESLFECSMELDSPMKRHFE